QGSDIHAIEPGERDIGMVFQNFTMFPTMSPFDNVGFPLKLMGLSKSEIKERVQRLVTYLGLQHLMTFQMHELSDSDKQRLSIARAMVRQPSLLLLDEPLTFLDEKLRMTLGAELRHTQRDMGITWLYFTHDQIDSLTMVGRIAVMDRGHLHQVDEVTTVYDRPATTFAARFVGSPSMNILDGTIDESGI